MNVLSIQPKKLILVTGPARSGKSEWAESLATASKQAVTYVATAQMNDQDSEWQARIEQHRCRRPDTWRILEVPIDLATTIATASPADYLLVDSLGTWLVNLLEQSDHTWQATQQEFIHALHQAPLFRSFSRRGNGLGVVPAYSSGRTFRDRLGTLTRQISEIADTVYLVTAGYALDLSLLGTPLDFTNSNKLNTD